MDHKIVKEKPDLIRDNHSKAIINTDSDGYNKRLIERGQAEQESMKDNLLHRLAAQSAKNENDINDINSKLDLLINLMSK